MSESSEALASRLRSEFLAKHRDAHFLVFDVRSRQAIGAVYYSPDWFDTPEVKTNELKEFFAQVAALDQQWVIRPMSDE